jgi:hypothetical protein
MASIRPMLQVGDLESPGHVDVCGIWEWDSGSQDRQSSMSKKDRQCRRSQKIRANCTSPKMKGTYCTEIMKVISQWIGWIAQNSRILVSSGPTRSKDMSSRDSFVWRGCMEWPSRIGFRINRSEENPPTVFERGIPWNHNIISSSCVLMFAALFLSCDEPMSILSPNQGNEDMGVEIVKAWYSKS